MSRSVKDLSPRALRLARALYREGGMNCGDTAAEELRQAGAPHIQTEKVRGEPAFTFVDDGSEPGGYVRFPEAHDEYRAWFEKNIGKAAKRERQS